MEFETIDWNLEARRVAQAFGLVGEYEFRPYSGIANAMSLHSQVDKYLFLNEDIILAVVFAEKMRCFTLMVMEDFIPPDGHALVEEYIAVEIDWNGQPKFRGENVAPCCDLLARALVCLGLLTPEIEAELEVNITAHEKLEWAREFEERYDL